MAKDARTKFDHLPPAFCRCSGSGKASHLIQQIPSGNLFPLPSRGRQSSKASLEGKLPPWAADEVLLTYILPLRCGRKAFHLIHRKRSPFPSRGRQSLLQPGSKDLLTLFGDLRGRTPRTRSIRLSCGKYRASSGPNEERASFAEGLEHKVLCQAFCERKRNKLLFCKS